MGNQLSEQKPCLKPLSYNDLHAARSVLAALPKQALYSSLYIHKNVQGNAQITIAAMEIESGGGICLQRNTIACRKKPATPETMAPAISWLAKRPQEFHSGQVAA
jgi:hypothetical protein